MRLFALICRFHVSSVHYLLRESIYLSMRKKSARVNIFATSAVSQLKRRRQLRMTITALTLCMDTSKILSPKKILL